MSIFDRVVKEISCPNATIVEVGANDGTHTKLFLEQFPAGRVFAFEPDPRAISKHRAAVSDPRAVLIPKGAGRVTGRTTFYQSTGEVAASDGHDWSEGWDQSGSIRTPKRHLECYPWVRFEKEIEIDIMSLDEWARCGSIAFVDLIWADVQGAEADLIEGARELLQRTKLFFTEYSVEELYEGAIDLPRILELLPNFEIVQDFPNVHDGNVLLRRKNSD
jgi:FkbM family methyltransferase